MADLSRSLLSEQLRALNRQRESGILALSSGEAVKGIFLQAGHVVFASSTVESDKLGENLIRLGRISRADFATAWEAAQSSPPRRLGRTLVEAGLLAEEELARLVAHQVQKIVLSTFTWIHGSMEFHAGAEAVPADLALDLSTHRLLLEGARVYPDAERLEAALGDGRRRLQVATRAPFDYSGLALAPAERAVLEGTADGLSLDEILASSMPRPLLVRAAYALLASGIVIDPAPASSPAAAEKEHDSGSFRIAHADPPPGAAATRASAARDRIFALYEAMPRATHYELLGVKADAGAAQIEKAWKAAEHEYQHEWKPLEGDARLASMISTLRLRRREAHRVLGDPVRRATYDRALGHGTVAGHRVPSAQEKVHAERITAEASRYLRRGELDAAVALLVEAVREEPGLRAARRLLALTLARHPRLHHEAERHFVSALDQDPSDLELRYQLALYYRREGLRARAIVQLQTVLEAQPQHAEAAKALRALRAEALPAR